MQVNLKTTDAQKEIASIKADAVISALMSKNHGQIDAWVDANLTSLADARAIIKKIIYVIRYILNAQH